MLHHNTQRSTFAIDITMASCQPPVKVKSTYSLYVAVSCAMKEHSLLNIKCAFDFSELSFLPLNQGTTTRVSFSKRGFYKNRDYRDVVRSTKNWLQMIYMNFFIWQKMRIHLTVFCFVSLIQFHRSLENKSLPAEELPQVQILNPLNAFDWMIHGPFVKSCNLFKFISISPKLNDL